MIIVMIIYHNNDNSDNNDDVNYHNYDTAGMTVDRDQAELVDQLLLLLDSNPGNKTVNLFLFLIYTFLHIFLILSFLLASFSPSINLLLPLFLFFALFLLFYLFVAPILSFPLLSSPLHPSPLLLFLFCSSIIFFNCSMLSLLLLSSTL